MSEKTYILTVDVTSKDPTTTNRDVLIESLEKDLEDTCNRDKAESRIRFVSLVLQP